MSVREVAMSGVGKIARVGISFSEITESKKCLSGGQSPPVVYYYLAGSQIELISCTTQQLSGLMLAEKVFQFCILHNFFT
jgi:hypothetical protein